MQIGPNTCIFNITVISLRNPQRFGRFGDILHVQLCSHRLLPNIWENLIKFHQTLSFPFQLPGYKQRSLHWSWKILIGTMYHNFIIQY